MMTTSTTSPPGPGLREGPADRASTPDPSPDRGVLVAAVLAVAVPVLGTIDVLRPVAGALGVLLLLAGPGYCVVVAAGFRNVGLRLAVTVAVSLGTIVLLATLLLYLGLWSTTGFAFAFGAVTLVLAALALPARTRRRTARRFVILAAGPVALGLLVGLLVPGAREDTTPTGTSRPETRAAAAPQTATARVWSVRGQWWALVWDESSDSYTFRRRTTDGALWQDTGVGVEAARGDAIDVLWNGTRLAVVVAGSTSDATPAALRAVGFVPNADGSGWVQDPEQPVSVVDGATTSPSLGKDGTGRFWTSYVQDGRVWLSHTAADDLTGWTTPVPVAAGPTDRVTTVDSTALVRLRKGRLGLLWSDGASRRLFWATRLAALDQQGAPEVSVVPVPDVNTGLLALEGLTANGSGHVYLIAQGWTRATADSAPRPVRVLLSRDRSNRWQPSRLTVSDAVTGTGLATDASTRTLYLFAANACCPKVETSYLTTSMDDPVLAAASAKGAPVSTGGTGLTHDVVRLTRGDPAAARMLRDDLLSPAPPAAAASDPGQAAAASGSSFRLRDVAVGLAVLATIALMVMMLRAETVAAGRSTVRAAGEPSGGRFQAPRWVALTLVVVACGVLLPRLWGLLT